MWITNCSLFSTQIIPNSGFGWDLFEVRDRTESQGADLCSKVPLDYENPQHRRKFHFKAQVSDSVSVYWFFFKIYLFWLELNNFILLL